MEEINKIVEACARKIYEETGSKPLCERCFYISDSQCPNFLHLCALEESLKNEKERQWTLENLKNKIKMREEFISKPLEAWR